MRMEENNTILNIKDLSKRFSSVTALDNVSLNVERGSIIGLLGPNGAGKTTLLRIINGLLAYDTGTVKLLGEDVSLKTTRHIGYMPEERGLYDNMSIEQQILYLGQLKGGDVRRMRIVMDEYLELFNLHEMKHRRVKELSKGNQQKVQIVSTLVHEPELVILDEPFSGFDPINGALLQDLLDRLHHQGATIMLSSHNMHAVEEMCTHIALVDHGHILLNGLLEDVKEENKTDDLLVTTRTPLHLEFLQQSGKITEVEQITPRVGRKGYAYRIKKTPGEYNANLIKEIALQSDVLHFEEALPTLNDIFIKYTIGEGANNNKTEEREEVEA